MMKISIPPLLKDSDGKPSASFTMVVIAFSIVTLWMFLSITEKVGNFSIRPFAASDAMSYLSPLLLLYFGRRAQTTSTTTTTESNKSTTE
jgi:hypothetical protein